MKVLSTRSIHWSRFLAITAVLIAAPIILLKLPWLPATVKAFGQTLSEFTTDGTVAYSKNRDERLWRLIAALALYLIGLCATFGVLGIALGLCKHPTAQRVAWLSALIIGVGLPIFESVHIAATTDRSYICLVIYLPIGVAILSMAALFFSLFPSPTSDAANLDQLLPK